MSEQHSPRLLAASYARYCPLPSPGLILSHRLVPLTARLPTRLLQAIFLSPPPCLLPSHIGRPCPSYLPIPRRPLACRPHTSDYHALHPPKPLSDYLLCSYSPKVGASMSSSNATGNEGFVLDLLNRLNRLVAGAWE